MMIITFIIADEVYGVELDAVDSVARVGRDDDVPVLDLPARLGGSSGKGGRREVHLRSGERAARVAVERLGEVREVDTGALHPVPRLFASALLRGVLALDDRLVIVLDAAALVDAAHAGDAVGGGVSGAGEGRPG